MNLFINNIYIHIARPEETFPDEQFNNIIDCGNEKITRANLIHHVWIKNPSTADLDEMLLLLDQVDPRSVYTVTISPTIRKEITNHIKSLFSILRAAGGVVRKGNKILMIFRMKKWDFPKGKINKNELPKDAAEREVIEECNIEVKVGEKVCNTWHTYTMKKKKILKKTTWYSMKLLDDSLMKPQKEEQIEELCWMSPKEVFHALDDSYESIRFVVDAYNKYMTVK